MFTGLPSERALHVGDLRAAVDLGAGDAFRHRSEWIIEPLEVDGRPGRHPAAFRRAGQRSVHTLVGASLVPLEIEISRAAGLAVLLPGLGSLSSPQPATASAARTKTENLHV